MNVKEFMKKSGMPMHMKGYEVLTMCLESSVENPDLTVQQLFDEVYKKHNCTHWSVYSNVKRVLDLGLPNMDKELKETLFPTGKKPTPAKFIKTVSYAIRKGII